MAVFVTLLLDLFCKPQLVWAAINEKIQLFSKEHHFCNGIFSSQNKPAAKRMGLLLADTTTTNSIARLSRSAGISTKTFQ